MVKKTGFSFLSHDKKTTIHGKKWAPADGNYRAVLQLVHGMVEFIDRYDNFARYMAERGFLVVGHDHLGHGDSVLSEDEWGYFAPNPSDTVVDDMYTVRTHYEDKDKPYFILGHSMGSYMTLKYLSKYGAGLAGAVIMGTGYVPEAAARAGLTLARGEEAVRGGHYRSKTIQGLAFGEPYRRYDMTGQDTANSWLTKDTEIVKKYYNEPRCQFMFTVNGYQGLFEAILDCENQENIANVPKDLPMLFVSGSDDPVGNMGKGVVEMRDLYENSGIKDITLRLYEGDRHEILNETDRDMVYAEIAEWIEKYI